MYMTHPCCQPSVSEFRFFIKKENYWWYTEIVKTSFSGRPAKKLKNLITVHSAHKHMKSTSVNIITLKI